MSKTSPAALAAATLALLAAAPPARAQQVATPTEAKAVDATAFKIDEPGTFASADLSYVLTSGNSTTNSLGFKGDVTHRWTKHAIGLAGGGLRASSSPDARFAVGTPAEFEVRVPAAELTAESYHARGRYDYKLSDRLFYALGAGWERNRFSGIRNRWVVDSGLGYILVANDRTDFRTALGITYTDEEYTVSDGRDGKFVGGRVGWDLRQQLLEGTTLVHTFIGDQSLEDSAARRFDAQLGVQVAMTQGLGLKVNWRVLYNNQPPSAEVPLLAPGGASTGLRVLAPYKKTDQGVSVSLVFSFAPPKKG